MHFEPHATHLWLYLELYLGITQAWNCTNALNGEKNGVQRVIKRLLCLLMSKVLVVLACLIKGNQVK